MFIKRAKSRPSIRARDGSAEAAPSPLGKSSFTARDDSGDSQRRDGDSEPENDSAIGSVMERKKAQRKEKDKRLGGVKSGGTRLSFGGEGDEGEGFKPRKSLLSQNVKIPPTPAPDSRSAGPSVAPSYSQEYLSQLKAATPTRSAQVQDEGMEVEPGEGSNGTGFSRVAKEKYAQSFLEDTTAGIPDSAAIASARMKRQAAVEMAKHGGTGNGDEEDYISLGGGKLIIHDGAEGPHPESRLMREDDEGDEGDEDYTEANDRLFIGKKANKDAARRLRGEIGDMIADREDEEESDEETREWEAAQARRAGGYDDTPTETAKAKGYQPTPIPNSRPLPTITSVQSRIAQSLAELNLTKSENEHSLGIASQELAALEEQERDLRKEVERVEGKREWVEEFRGWVEMLGGFLEEKLPKLDALEADGIGHLGERAEMVTKRRTADDSDDLALFLGVPAATESDIEEVDEMGRSRRDYEAGPSSGVRKGRRNERETRRTRRRTRRPAQASPAGDEEGYSTDSTLADGDAEDYAQAQVNLARRVEALLDDVKAEDFRDPSKGLAVRFGDWRKRYEEEYVGAFGGLSMVQAWSFWARGEMAGWEPLRVSTSLTSCVPSPINHQSSITLDSFTWFTALHDYSHPRSPTANGNGPDDMDLDDDEPPLGPDGDLNAQMVNDAVVPLLTKAFENGAYDPYSLPQTRRAVDLVEVVETLAGKDSRKFTVSHRGEHQSHCIVPRANLLKQQGLLKAVLSIFQEHIFTLTTTVSSCSASGAIPPPSFDPASRAVLQRFVRRRIKLMRNMLLWRHQAPDEVRQLVCRLVREVLRPCLATGWRGGGQEIAEKVLQSSGGLLSQDLVVFLQRGPAR